jgi:hypothetical protein
MLEPSQEYFLLGFVALCTGLTLGVSLEWRFEKLWILATLILCIALASMMALFSLDFLGPDGAPHEDFWVHLTYFFVVTALPLALGLSVLQLVSVLKPKEPD